MDPVIRAATSCQLFTLFTAGKVTDSFCSGQSASAGGVRSGETYFYIQGIIVCYCSTIALSALMFRWLQWVQAVRKLPAKRDGGEYHLLSAT